MRSRLADRLVSGIFIVALAVPLLASAARIGTDAAAETTRDAGAPAGVFGWLDAFDDHFGLRTYFIHAHALTALRIFKVSPSPTVIRGRDGWLYYADDGSLEDFESAAPMSGDELADWRDAIVRTRDALRTRGIAYVFVLAPDKHVIYPEHLPTSMHRLHDGYRMDQLAAYLQQTTDVPVVDLRDTLMAAKRIEQVYYRTDTHWNDAGAYAGYVAILSAAARQLPGLQPAPRCDFRAVPQHGPGRDLAEMLGIEHSIDEDTVRLQRISPRARILEPATMREGFEVARVITEVPDARLPRAVIFRDSFGSALIPFISEHFSRAVYLWQNDVDLDVVDAEKPALVIQEIVGRRLQTYEP